MVTPSPETITAVYRAADDRGLNLTRADCAALLEAAAPAIRADAEEYFAAAAREELAKPLADLGAKITREATAAERERCAQLADQHGAAGAKCSKGEGIGSACGCRSRNPRFPFADLLRDQPPEVTA